MSYQPSLLDIAWMQRLVKSLNLHGTWGYKDRPIVFQKTAENVMTLISAPTGDRDVEEQIERNRVVMKKAGIEFEDARVIAASRCHICKRALGVAGDPLSKDCGGDCIKCMADAGDPDAILYMRGLNK